MPRRRFPSYNKLSPPTLFTWVPRPDFRYSDISQESPLDLPGLSREHNGEAPEPFVQSSAPESFISSTFHESAWQRFSSIYGQIDSSIQSRKRGKYTRARAFMPLPAIDEEDNLSSSQIYQPVPIWISRNILPIEEEEEEEENEPPECVDDFNFLPGKVNYFISIRYIMKFAVH